MKHRARFDVRKSKFQGFSGVVSFVTMLWAAVLLDGALGVTLQSSVAHAGQTGARNLHGFDSSGKRNWVGWFQGRNATEAADPKRQSDHQRAAQQHQTWVNENVGVHGLPIPEAVQGAAPVSSKQSALLKRFEDRRHGEAAAAIDQRGTDEGLEPSHLEALHNHNNARQSELHSTLDAADANVAGADSKLQGRALAKARKAQSKTVNAGLAAGQKDSNHMQQQNAALIRRVESHNRRVGELLRRPLGGGLTNEDFYKELAAHRAKAGGH